MKSHVTEFIIRGIGCTFICLASQIITVYTAFLPKGALNYTSLAPYTAALISGFYIALIWTAYQITHSKAKAIAKEIGNS